MKVCEKCGADIDGKRDGENRCDACENGRKPRKRKGLSAKDKHDIMTSLGLTRVRGAMGGVYYE